MAIGHLGKGLGALFPSLNSKSDEKNNLKGMKSEKPVRPDAHHGTSVSRNGSFSISTAQPDHQVSSADRRKAQSARIDTSENAMSADVKNDAATRHIHKQNIRGTVQNPRESKNNGNRSASLMRTPGWGGIAHPVDMFFGGTDLAATTDNVSRETLSTPKQSVTQKSEHVASTDSNAVQEGTQDRITKPLQEVRGGYLSQISVDDIVPNPRQPRTVFDEEELKQLADSIKEVGVLQPIVVVDREKAEDSKNREGHSGKAFAEENTHQARYELIMGERRLRASKIAGLKTIPAIVRTANGEQMLRDALLENLQRVQLNPLEEAAAYQQMMQDFGLTQERLSQAVAKSRSQIANTLRLLQLPGQVQKLVASGVISAGHARALLGLKSSQQMVNLADRIVKEGLSVRSTEEIVALQSGTATAKKRKSTQRSADYWAGTGLPEQLEEKLQTKVAIHGNEKKGRIVITFTSREDLDRLTKLLTNRRDASDSDNGWV